MKIIGHRGAAGLAFENTLGGIEAAIRLGVEFIEVDVWKTIDGQIVVFHDAYLDRLTNDNRRISSITYNELQNIKLKNGENIPKLEEVLGIVKSSGTNLLVELKDENAATNTLALLESELPPSRFIIGSFFHAVIRKIKQVNPILQTAIMLECVPDLLDEYLNYINPDYVVSSIETYNNYFIKIVKSQDRKLIFYTVNTKAEIRAAVKAQPYAIVTNFPNIFISGDV